MARRWGGLIGALSLLLLDFYGGTMIDVCNLSGGEPFLRGYYWTIDAERLPTLLVTGHANSRDADRAVEANPDYVARVPEAVAVALVSILSGLIPRGECELTWPIGSLGSGD